MSIFERAKLVCMITSKTSEKESHSECLSHRSCPALNFVLSLLHLEKCFAQTFRLSQESTTSKHYCLYHSSQSLNLLMSTETIYDLSSRSLALTLLRFLLQQMWSSFWRTPSSKKQGGQGQFNVNMSEYKDDHRKATYRMREDVDEVDMLDSTLSGSGGWLTWG